MWRAARKSVLAHKLRLALSALAVVLGVAFVAGTFVLTDTMQSSFTSLFGNVDRNVSVQVRSVANLDADTPGDAPRTPLPDSLVATVSALPGVAGATGAISGYAQLTDPQTHKAITTTGAPTLGVSFDPESKTSVSTLLSGRAPAGPHEIVVDKYTADKHHFAVGQQADLTLATGPYRATVVGIFALGGSDSLGGATVTGFDLATAQQVMGEPGKVDSIEIAAAPGVSQQQLRDTVARALPAGVEAITGAQLAKETSDAINKGFASLSTLILAFAGICLFVGTFIIFITFSMLVAQRTRELALYRALGASRRQVTRSVLAEAAMTGVFGSVLGLGAGVLLAWGLYSVVGGFLGLTAQPLVVAPRTVIAALLVGTLVTTAVGYLPARRAGRVPPIAAMREDVTVPERSLRIRGGIGGALAVTGAALLLWGVTGGPNPGLSVGLGAGVIFIGAIALSPLLSRPAIRALGAPLPRLWGVSGRLGRENALRSPRRTAATASALMIGVALVTAVGTLGASLVASLDATINRSLGADLMVTSVSSQEVGVPSSVAGTVAGLPGVGKVAEVRGNRAEFDGKRSFLTATTVDTGPASVGLQATAGDLTATLRGGQLAVQQDVADARGWHVGQSVSVTTATGAHPLTIGALYGKQQILSPYLVGIDTFAAINAKDAQSTLDEVVLVSLAKDAKAATVKDELTKATADLPTVMVRDQTDFKKQVESQVSVVLGILYVLLAMSILIAILGIINTLALAVFERTREIGLLRAVGLGRVQLRQSIRLESTVIAIFGAVFGISLGLFFGWALQRAFAKQGMDVLAFPWTTIVVSFVASGVVGVLAALWPAWRASRMNVLQAIATT